MNKVLLANSYFYKLDPKQWRFKQPYPPLGTLQAAAVVREAGFDTAFHDVSLSDSPVEIERILHQQKPEYFILYDDGFNYLTKMCLTVMRQAAFAMIALAKQQGCIVIICSSDATDHYEKYIMAGVDYVIRGEGEETLRDLLSGLSQKKDVSQITGLAFQQSGMAMITPPRPVLRDLDRLPFPAWDLIDLAPYRTIWEKHHGYFSLNLATTRGCPYKCNWCAKPIYGNRYNSRSPEHVIREIELLINTYKPDHFWMCDDIFGLKPNWITQFKNLVQEKRISFRYKIQSRADLLLEDNSIQSLAESGCETIWLGAESGSQKILDAMDKGTTLAQIRKATQLLKLHHINTGYFLQFGYPGETRQDIEATIKLVLEEMPEEIGISVSYPLPGTKFYEQVKAQLLEKQNWTDSDDLAMLYESTFPQGYYKILQRYVHSRFRIQRGLNRVKDLLQKPVIDVRDFRKIASMIYNFPVSRIHAYRLKRLQAHHA
jgi:anaerobic magnesium-protoporphyrin IX monomethyl ester cyclase